MNAFGGFSVPTQSALRTRTTASTLSTTPKPRDDRFAESVWLEIVHQMVEFQPRQGLNTTRDVDRWGAIVGEDGIHREFTPRNANRGKEISDTREEGSEIKFLRNAGPCLNRVFLRRFASLRNGDGPASIFHKILARSSFVEARRFTFRILRASPQDPRIQAFVNLDAAPSPLPGLGCRAGLSHTAQECAEVLKRTGESVGERHGLLCIAQRADDSVGPSGIPKREEQ